MSKIVISGAGGIIGSSVLETFSQHANNQIAALTRSAYVPESTDTIIWKSTDYSKEDLVSILSGANTIIHLAGTKGDKTNLSNFDSDIKMTGNILEAAVRCGVCNMIYSSSRLVYFNPDTIPWTETTTPEPASAYAVNKLRSEELCRKYSQEYGVNIVVARIAQVISERDKMHNMINVFRDLSISGKALTVMGKSVAKRQYIYVKDLAEIIYRLSNLEICGFEIVNIGMPDAYTNYEIAQAFREAYGNEAEINYDDSKPETVTPSVMDVTKMLKLTDYIPMDMYLALCDMASQPAS